MPLFPGPIQEVFTYVCLEAFGYLVSFMVRYLIHSVLSFVGDHIENYDTDSNVNLSSVNSVFPGNPYLLGNLTIKDLADSAGSSKPKDI